MRSCSEEVRKLRMDGSDPTLVGLTPGAAAVLRTQQTRHTLGVLRHAQLTQAANNEVDSAQPLQVGFVRRCVCEHRCMCEQVHTRTHMRVYTHTHTHTQTHTHQTSNKHTHTRSWR